LDDGGIAGDSHTVVGWVVVDDGDVGVGVGRKLQQAPVQDGADAVEEKAVSVELWGLSSELFLAEGDGEWSGFGVGGGGGSLMSADDGRAAEPGTVLAPVKGSESVIQEQFFEGGGAEVVDVFMSNEAGPASSDRIFCIWHLQDDEGVGCGDSSNTLKERTGIEHVFEIELADNGIKGAVCDGFGKESGDEFAVRMEFSGFVNASGGINSAVVVKKSSEERNGFSGGAADFEYGAVQQIAAVELCEEFFKWSAVVRNQCFRGVDAVVAVVVLVNQSLNAGIGVGHLQVSAVGAGKQGEVGSFHGGCEFEREWHQIRGKSRE